MSPQLTTEEPNIDELAKKLGMHLPANDPAASGFGEKTAEGDDAEPEVEIEDEADNENEQEKRDPEKNRARISFSNNGFSKAAVVAGGSLLAISAVVFFYTSVASNVSKKPPEVQKAEQQEKKPEDQRIADLQQSESQARAELALQRQQQELAKINTPEKPGGQTQQKPAKPSTTATAGARTTSPPVQSVPVSRSFVREPRVIDRSPPPIVAASRPQLARLPVPSAPPSRASTVSQVDPQAEWNRLASLGRYGSVSPGISQVASSSLPSSPGRSGTSPTASTSTASASSSPSSGTSRGGNDRTAAAPAIERSTAPPLSQYVRSRSTASTAAPSAQLVANADKSAQLEVAQASPPTASASRRSVLVGSTARARVVSTIVWAAGARSSPRFLIRLSEPLLDSADQPILPADSLLVVSPRPLADETGLADLEVIAVVAGDAEYATPSGSIVIRGVGGDPLMARGSRRGSTFLGDAALIVSSMLSQVGGLTNQPTTTSSTSTASGVGTVTSSSSTSPPPNYLGAAMQGGFEALSETLSERNQSAIDEITSAPKVFQIPGGTSVQVFVNRTMTF